MKLGKSLRWKMVAGSTAIITLLLVVIGTFVIRQVSQIEYRNAVKANQTLAQAMSDRFNENSDAFVHQIDFVTLDGEISNIMEKGGSSQAEIYFNRKELRSVITLRSIAMDVISGVYLYDANGDLVTKWEKTPNKEGTYRLPNTTDISRFELDGRVTSEFLDGHLVYNRAVRTLETRIVVGYITFLYDDQVLKERLDVIAGNSNNFLGLYDSVDDVLICRDNIDKEAYLQALADQDLADAQGGITFTVDGIGQMLLCSNEVMNDGWYFLSAVPNDDIYEMQSLLVLMILSFVLIAVLLILCITALNHTIITGPIGHIMDAVKKIQNEDYDITLDVHTGDEIEILADNLNIMARRIDELVNQNLKANLAYKEMQITQLQHQIKPHFLYNTLECINALSQMGRTEEVRIITGAFAKLMKNRMSDAHFTTVKEEMACVDSFLQIYQTMQAGQLYYTITVDPQCEPLRIPSMIVQPLVENAVLHGIVPSARQGTCTVEAYCEDDHLCIQVSDDGVGLSRESLDAVNRYIAGKATEEDTKNLGIGIRNVVDRIRFVYGGSGSIAVLSDAEWGTSITCALPITTNL